MSTSDDARYIFDVTTHKNVLVLYYLLVVLCRLWEDLYQISGVISPCGFHKVNGVILNVPSR